MRIWDLPTRLVHWFLAAALAGAWATAELGRYGLHRACGYTALGLVLFRIYWGFAGSSTARFSRFLSGPSHVVGYLRSFARGESRRWAGHNPAGGWSTIMLLVLVILQAALGLFAVSADGIESGPLSSLVSFIAGRRMAKLHEVNFNVLAVFLALHILAVVAYLVWRRENLVASMISGDAIVVADRPTSLGRVAAWRAWIGASVVALIMLAIVFLPTSCAHGRGVY